MQLFRPVDQVLQRSQLASVGAFVANNSSPGLLIENVGAPAGPNTKLSERSTTVGAGLVSTGDHVIVARLTFPAGQDEIVLGRGQDVDLYLGDPRVSKRHCSFLRRGAEYVVRDLQSTNGTMVAGELLRGPDSTRVLSMDLITLGGGLSMVFLSAEDLYKRLVAFRFLRRR